MIWILTGHAEVLGLRCLMVTFGAGYRLTTWVLEPFPSNMIFTKAYLDWKGKPIGTDYVRNHEEGDLKK